jgi:hypothetical protein
MLVYNTKEISYVKTVSIDRYILFFQKVDYPSEFCTVKYVQNLKSNRVSEFH